MVHQELAEVQVQVVHREVREHQEVQGQVELVVQVVLREVAEHQVHQEQVEHRALQEHQVQVE